MPWQTDSAAEAFVAWLLTLQLGVVLIVLLLWCQRGGGITEAEEWRSFVLGWALVPPGAIGLRRAFRALAARLMPDPSAAEVALATFNALVLLGMAVALRTAAPGWASVSVPYIGEPALAVLVHPVFAWLCVGFAVSLPMGDLGLLLALRRGFLRGTRFGFASPAIAACLPLLTLATVTSAGVQHLPPVAQILAVVGGAVIATRLLRKGWPSGSSRIADLLVVALLAALSFDPHLHFDTLHHNWYLGPVHALRQGRIPLVDFVAAYGVLPFYLLALFFRASGLPLSYPGLALAVSILLFLFYGAVYLLLRILMRRQVTALASMVCVLLIHFFGVHGAYTVYPSGGPLRFLPPFLLLLCSALRARRVPPQRASRVGEIALLAVSSLWSVETFVYSLGAWLGVAALEFAFARREGGAWLQIALRRLALAAACVVAVQIAHALVLRGISGEWPDYGRYLTLVASFSPRGGIAVVSASPGGPWLAVVLVQLGSLLGCLHAVPSTRTQRGRASLATVAGLTVTGIAQLTYWLGLSIPYRICNIAIPAVIVAAFWGERLTHSVALPSAFRSALALGLAAVLLLIPVNYASHVRMWLEHAGPGSLGAAAAVAAVGGCDALPDCLVRPRAVHPKTKTAIALLQHYSPGRREAAVFLAAPVTTEVLMRSGRPHAFPVVDPTHDVMGSENARWIVEHASHRLGPGDIILVDREALAATGLRGEALLRSMVERLCDEFRCVEIEKRGSLAIERLEPRRSSDTPSEDRR